jgi:hypothetical protein
LVGGLLAVALVLLFGGLGFAFDLNQLLNSPIVNGDSAVGGWVGGGTNSLNLLHIPGYDQQVIPTVWVVVSYGLTGALYLGIMVVTWWRQRAFSRLPDKKESGRLALLDCLLGIGLVFVIIFFLWVRMHERYLYYGIAVLPFLALWRRDLYKPLLSLNLFFIINLLYAYLPERRDPIPNNFSLWRRAFHEDWFQNLLSLGGLLLCGWLVWLYFKPQHKPVKAT